MSGLIERLKEQPAFYSLNGADDIEIINAENTLRVTFAPDYREYLKTFALASFEGHEFTGICKSSRLNVVDVTLNKRQICGEMANGMYVIEDAGIDGITVFQREDGSIVCLAPGIEPRKIADSIDEYITL